MSTLKPILNAAPQDAKTMPSTLDALLRYNNLRFECMLPAIVEQYDRAKNQATVRPLVMWVDTQDGTRERDDVTNIPVLSLGGGGFHISFPIEVGDLGWIYASDRDLSQFKSTLAKARPNSARNHTFEDGLFIPDVFRRYTISGEDSGAMVIQSTSSATRISIRDDNIKITTPTVVTIDANVAITKNLTVAGDVTIAGEVAMNKSLAVAIEATVAGTHVTTHGHVSAAPGTRTSGGMIP